MTSGRPGFLLELECEALTQSRGCCGLRVPGCVPERASGRAGWWMSLTGIKLQRIRDDLSLGPEDTNRDKGLMRLDLTVPRAESDEEALVGVLQGAHSLLD